MDIDNMSNSEELFLIKHQADILINSPSHTFNKNDSINYIFKLRVGSNQDQCSSLL
jgi:hypothetical protein